MPPIKSHYAYGFYQVADQQFLNKTDALVAASRLNHDVVWNFHDNIYNQFDWTQRPQGTLAELYRRRAQQIRDQYDYVVVNFSGGADSWNVLHSFLSNNIHVDEVFTRWALTERKYKPANFQDRKETNLTSEYEYAVLPVLEDIRRRYPQTLIHIDDYSNEYEKDIQEHDIQHGGHYLTLGVFYRFVRKSPMEQQAAKQGKRVAVVHGFDKIQYRVQDDVMYAYFIDRFGGTDLDPERNIEAFYWTPDMPEIPIAQAHEMKLFYEQRPDLCHHLNGETHRKSYIQVCYPKYNLETFQVGKPIGSEIWQSEMWIRQHNPRYIKSWQWALDQYMPNIDSKFYDLYNDRFRVGYKTFCSKLYSLGKFSKLDK